MAQEGRDEKGRFAAGNKIAESNREYGTPEELRAVAEEYIETTRQKNGAYKPTLTGLVYHLGFESLQSFYDYEKREPFSYTVRRLRLFIQSCYEQQLYTFAWAGASFALRNIGKGDWQDEVVQQQHQTVTSVQPQVIQGDAPALAGKESDVKP